MFVLLQNSHKPNINSMEIIEKYALFWFLFFLLQSCGQEGEASFILADPHVNKLAIIGFLGNNEVPIIDISAIASFSDDGFDPNVTDALPVLWEGDIPVDTFRYQPCELGCYRRLQGAYLGDTLRLHDGADYSLVVSAPGYETAIVHFPVFNQVFSSEFSVYYQDTVHAARGVEGVVKLQYEIINDINFGYIDNIRKNVKFGITSSSGRLFNPQTFNVWRFLERSASGQPNPFFAGSVDSLLHGFWTSSSPEEFEQRILDSLLNDHLYAVHMTEEYAEAFTEYLNDTAREEPGGPFVDQQLLADNVENGYGYVVMVDMVGGRVMLR